MFIITTSEFSNFGARNLELSTNPCSKFLYNLGPWCIRNGSNAPVPLRPAVLRFIPEPPGHPGSWTGMNRVTMTFFCRKISTVDRRGPQRPGSTPAHPGSPRFSGRFSTVHPGPCWQNPGDATVLPGSPRRSYGPSRFTTVHPGEVKMQYK